MKPTACVSAPPAKVLLFFCEQKQEATFHGQCKHSENQGR